MLDLGIHIVSVLGQLFGYSQITVPKATLVREKSAPGDGETYADVDFNIQGVATKIEVGKWMPDTQTIFVFRGDIGTLEVDLEKRQLKVNGVSRDGFLTHEYSYRALLMEFLTSVDSRRYPRTTFEDGYRALEVIMNLYKEGGA